MLHLFYRDCKQALQLLIITDLVYMAKTLKYLCSFHELLEFTVFLPNVFTLLQLSNGNFCIKMSSTNSPCFFLIISKNAQLYSWQQCTMMLVTLLTTLAGASPYVWMFHIVSTYSEFFPSFTLQWVIGEIYRNK